MECVKERNSVFNCVSLLYYIIKSDVSNGAKIRN